MTEIQNKKDKWFQINEEGIKIFNEILRSLIAFHEMIHGSTKVLDETWVFKKRLVESANPLVAIKKFGDYEYLVFAKIKDKYNSWIHIDGIQMERIELEKIGTLKHDVFNILNMTDIYIKHCEPYSGEIPEGV
ncbi:LIC_13246 family protein [Leptospira licerasiae]|uniref:LIC_13246 family protein n=1 Tax=Leptospira licerasiae TaxID=447106 RepID=UPI00301610AE